MLRESEFYCPECDDGLDASQHQHRRTFLKVMSTAAAAVAAGGAARAFAADPSGKRTPKPAEGLIRELYSTFSSEQKNDLVLPFDHGGDGGIPTRLRTFNSPVMGKRIGGSYTQAQQDLVKEILISVLSGKEAFERLSRDGKWDGSGSFEGCGALIFGEPGDNSKFAWVFSGHHITLRCDGNSHPNAAFGGPIYYGHSVAGHNERNVYNYQTRQVHAVFESLTEAQRAKAIAPKNPGDGHGGLKPQDPRHGIAFSELTADQKKLVEGVMRTLLDPFRKEDGDEVMQIVKAGGGLDQINLAFYKDPNSDDEHRWHFWRVEGPGFVWNYRVLPHVHCFVNIAGAA